MKTLLVILFLILSSTIFSDFIIPISDPVYEFLEMTNTRRLSNLNHFIFPLYHSEVMNELRSISDNNDSGVFKEIARSHYKRLGLEFDEGTNIAVLPPHRMLESFRNMFRNENRPQRFLTYRNAETQIYLSTLWGIQHDWRVTRDSTVTRTRVRYGIESAGNFSSNFGFYYMVTMGIYRGNSGFIKENPFISWDGTAPWEDRGRFYINEIQLELDFKNPYLNLSLGYGTFNIGQSVTSSIILNHNTTPYGYFKFNRRIGRLEYTGFTAQLIPHKPQEDVGYRSKSMAFHTLTWNSSAFTLGAGVSVIYGNRSIDLGYAFPLAFFKVMENNHNHLDNQFAFAFAEVRPLPGISVYGNINFDDIRRERLFRPERMSYLALQGGIKYQLRSVPLQIVTEVTAVGPSMYAHGTSDNHLNFTHDDMLLGSKHGSNFLSLASRIRYHHHRGTLTILYENVQQSNIAHDPFRDEWHEEIFLSGKITRSEFLNIRLDLRLIHELNTFISYKYQRIYKERRHSFFTGLEFRF
ncbi:MAG: hypothetical protein LBE23_12420 [Vagococcus sp.]|jgi:hypothetical protein|nr:hypothetical protein [Vagococcus sp.]